MLNEVGVRSNRTRVPRVTGAAWVCRQPACTSAESKLVPVCQEEASKALGAWKSACVLTDHIALEVGFSKQAYQAQCVTIDYAGGQEKFVHVKNNAPWFLAAVGGPNCKRSSLPAVYVIEALQSKMFDAFDKQVVEDADRGRGEYGENEEGVTDDLPVEDDPMLLLGACSHEHLLETPKKCKPRKTDEDEIPDSDLLAGAHAYLAGPPQVSATPCSVDGCPYDSNLACDTCGLAFCSRHARRCYTGCDYLFCHPCFYAHSCVLRPPSPDEARSCASLCLVSSFVALTFSHVSARGAGGETGSMCRRVAVRQWNPGSHVSARGPGRRDARSGPPALVPVKFVNGISRRV